MTFPEYDLKTCPACGLVVLIHELSFVKCMKCGWEALNPSACWKCNSDRVIVDQHGYHVCACGEKWLVRRWKP